MEQRQATLDEEALAADVAENGMPKGGRSSRASPSSRPRATRSSSAPTPSRTWSARRGGTTTARFLYVEAFNKSTKITGNSTVSGPTLALTYAGADGVYNTTAVNMGRFVDTDPTPDLLHVPPAADPPPGGRPTSRRSASPPRRPPAAPSASVETYTVTEWLGKDLPPHVAGFKNQPFFTHYMDPTENRADLDALAAANPDLMSVVNMPEKTSGYQRKSQAIMSGSNAIGSAPPRQPRRPAAQHHGRDHGRAAGRQHPVHRLPRGRPSCATVDGIPSGSTDFILTLKDPDGTVLQTVDTGTSPEFINRTFTTAGTYTFEVSGFQGDLGDFTFKIQPVIVTAATATASAVVLTTKAWGHEGGNQVRPSSAARARRQHAAERRGQRQAGRGLPGHRRQRALRTRRPSRSSPPSTPTPRPPRCVTATTYRGNAGAGIVPPRARINLSDFLAAPASVARGPFQQHLYRIGSSVTAPSRASSCSASSTLASGPPA